MLRSDAQVRDLKVDSLMNNINAINVDAIAHVEKELDPYDVESMVFLLYDVPDTALQRLIVHQRVARDIGDKELGLLKDWAQHAQSTKPTWKYEFIEALAICQLYSVIRKLGFNTLTVKKEYLPNNNYINPMKKALYILCENVTSDNLKKLQNTLKSYQINTHEYKSCEQVLLELMCKKFICIDSVNANKAIKGKYDIENLAKIIQVFPELQKCAEDLRELQRKLNNMPTVTQSPSSSATVVKDDYNSDSDSDDDKCTPDDFKEIFELLKEMDINEDTQLKSDTRKYSDDIYTIKNPKRIGVCYIINQEDFHPSKQSIENYSQSRPLEKRTGSNRDKKILEKTMTALNFEVICHRNLDHTTMLEYIKSIIQYRVHPDDSVFMLCILTHGVREHVYAADSVKVKIDHIQNLLDEGLRERNLDIPKVMILQACRVNNDEEFSKGFVADGPLTWFRPKLNFLIYWATAPELEAYRHEKKGSIFIQVLCHFIQKCANEDHLEEIFRKVNAGVDDICRKFKILQVPFRESSLIKKLYLKVPE